MPLLAFDRVRDNAAAIDMTGNLPVSDLRQGSVPACARPAQHAFDDRYSIVGNRVASFPDLSWSRIESGRGIRAEPYR
jgi:hypothetical protein